MGVADREVITDCMGQESIWGGRREHCMALRDMALQRERVGDPGVNTCVLRELYCTYYNKKGEELAFGRKKEANIDTPIHTYTHSVVFHSACCCAVS